MQQEDYLNKKLNEAKEFLKSSIGLKHVYQARDIFMLFTKFGWVEEIDLEDLYSFLPTKGYDFSSIESFTNGFIKKELYRIYAVRMGHHFNLFVVEYNSYDEAISYYSNTINDETMSICYILEVITNN